MKIKLKCNQIHGLIKELTNKNSHNLQKIYQKLKNYSKFSKKLEIKKVLSTIRNI